ncbi:MAG TPA: nuclear transport factor 2 family protein [Gemmatimonadales bacterium]|nr:nuclear transport factor 2 family protein [Gemmatimonadales bacterium]
MRNYVLLVATLLAACRGSARPGTDTTPVADRAGLTRLITAQLERAADDWNRGDLDGFLSDYAAESTTTYVDGRRARAGIDFIRSRYAPRFSPGADRGTLHFEEVQVRPLSSTLALVTARFILQRKSAVNSSGPFTLVMERRGPEWKILHDHSSSDPR